MQRLSDRVIGTNNYASDTFVPNIILLHGWGANMHDLVGIKDLMSLPLDWKFVNAPRSLGGNGYAWFPRVPGPHLAMDPLSYFNNLGSGLWSELAIAGEYLAQEIEQHLPPETPIFLGGFSQGAIVAFSQLYLGHIRNDIRGFLLFSPTAWAGIEEREVTRKKLPPVFLSHGSDDPILQVDGSRRIREVLHGKGLECDYHEFRGYHEIPEHICYKAKDFVRSLLVQGDSGGE